MRQSQHGKKPRGRGRKQHNPLSRVYDSNGPDVKIRGTASHVADKYLNLARDAHSSGDRIAAENYLQHAEHYLRIIAAAQSQMSAAMPQGGEQPSADDQASQPEAAENGQGGERDDTGRDSQPAFEGRSRRGRRRTGARNGEGYDNAPSASSEGDDGADTTEAEVVAHGSNGDGGHAAPPPMSARAHDDAEVGGASEPDPATPGG